MNKKLILGAVLGVAALAASGVASAHVDLSVGIGVPAYVAPAPVYVAPPPPAPPRRRPAPAPCQPTSSCPPSLLPQFSRHALSGSS